MPRPPLPAADLAAPPAGPYRPARGGVTVVTGGVLLLALADDGPPGDCARGALRAAGRAAVPDAALLEVLAALRRALLAGLLAPPEFLDAVERLGAMPLLRAPSGGLLGRAAALAPWLPPRTAACVALAEALGGDLVARTAPPVPARVISCAVRPLGEAP